MVTKQVVIRGCDRESCSETRIFKETIAVTIGIIVANPARVSDFCLTHPDGGPSTGLVVGLVAISGPGMIFQQNRQPDRPTGSSIGPAPGQSSAARSSNRGNLAEPVGEQSLVSIKPGIPALIPISGITLNSTEPSGAGRLLFVRRITADPARGSIGKVCSCIVWDGGKRGSL